MGCVKTLHLKYQKHIKAGHGGDGSGNLKTGKDGEDKVIEVPLGTVARDGETGEYLFEITEDGEQKILQKGGRGGLGNDNFKSPTNQTPRYAQPGEDGREGWKILELKILADVGLVGFQTQGKAHCFLLFLQLNLRLLIIHLLQFARI